MHMKNEVRFEWKEKIMAGNVLNYIEKNWDNTVKFNQADDGTLIGLPYPYSVPAVGHFDEIYYWDTYFTNKGLEICGRMAQVKNNTDNMLYLVHKYGFMPNGNRTYYLKNSQPPFLSFMVRDVYEYYKDEVWLSSAYNVLCKEYEFWITRRGTKCGLSCYSGTLSEDDYESLATLYKQRCGIIPDAENKDVAMHYIGTCESGWDLNPRWHTELYHYAPVDLNSLLYAFEKNMEYFSEILRNNNESMWKERAEKRKNLMLKYMPNKNGILYDYNFNKEQISDILSVASFYPMFVNMVDDEMAGALVKVLPRLEFPYGLVTCEKNDVEGNYQWDYPNGWPCLQYIAVVALDNYGYKDEAKRIAEKYIKLADKVFDETGKLWEKYNVVQGNINVTNEYEMPPMMGWTAGVYLALNNYIANNTI